MDLVFFSLKDLHRKILQKIESLKKSEDAIDYEDGPKNEDNLNKGRQPKK